MLTHDYTSDEELVQDSGPYTRLARSIPWESDELREAKEALDEEAARRMTPEKLTDLRSVDRMEGSHWDEERGIPSKAPNWTKKQKVQATPTYNYTSDEETVQDSSPYKQLAKPISWESDEEALDEEASRRMTPEKLTDLRGVDRTEGSGWDEAPNWMKKQKVQATLTYEYTSDEVLVQDSGPYKRLARSIPWESDKLHEEALVESGRLRTAQVLSICRDVQFNTCANFSISEVRY